MPPPGFWLSWFPGRSIGTVVTRTGGRIARAFPPDKAVFAKGMLQVRKTSLPGWRRPPAAPFIKADARHRRSAFEEVIDVTPGLESVEGVIPVPFSTDQYSFHLLLLR